MGKAKYLYLGDTIGLIKEFFKPLIKDPELLREYNDTHYSSQVMNVRIGHFFATLIFIGFGIFDYFSLQDSHQFFLLNSVRFPIVLFVFVPFYFFTFSPKFKHYIRPSIFITYLLLGGFISYSVFVLDNDKSTFTNNYYALDLIILAVFIMLTVRLKDTLLLAFLLIGLYNGVWVHNIMNNPDYVNGFIDLKFFLDFNVWLVTVVIVGALLWWFFQNLSKKNFMTQRNLSIQKQELKRANDVKNKFFSLLTHDLKSLIGSQYSLASCLVDSYDELTTDKQKEFIDTLGDASARTLKVFDELSLWVHAQTHMIEINKQKVVLEQVVNEVEELLSLELKEKEVRVINQVAVDLELYCDLNTLKTVLRNLLGNALKFSYPNAKIFINAQVKEDHIEIVVIDQGVGMSKKTLNSLFQIDKTNSSIGTNGEKGTGLGLILAKELLELNEGCIWANSIEGQGSYMYFRLPKFFE